MRLKVRPGILEIAPYVGGEASCPASPGPIEAVLQREPAGPQPEGDRGLSRGGGRAAPLSRRRASESCARRSRRRFGLEADRIVCGAGSDELICLLTRAYAGPGDEVLFSRHGFLMYPLSRARRRGHAGGRAGEGLRHRCRRAAGAVTPATRIVFLANPNNPTGSYLPAAQLRGCAGACRSDVLLVIDAAYAEYVDAANYEAGVELVRAGRQRRHAAHLLEDLRPGAACASAGPICPPASPTC